MKKKAFVAIVIWFLGSGLLGWSMIKLSGTENVPYRICLQFLATLVAIPMSILFTKALIGTGNEAESIQYKDNKLETGLPLSGTIFGPAFGLPDYFKATYSGAKHSPVVFYHHKNNKYTGFTIDFGNGKAGMKDGSIFSSPSEKGLSIQVSIPGQLFNIG
jgi:hypothetical protein